MQERGAASVNNGAMTPRRTENGPRRAATRTLFILVTLFVFYYLVIPTLIRSSRNASLLSQVNPALLLLAVALEVASLVCYAVLTRVTLPDQPRLHLFTLFRIQLATRAVTNVVPGGSAAGSTLGYRLLTDAGISSSAAGFSLATVGLGSAVVLNLILWVALLISIPLNGFRTAYVTAAIVGVLLLGFVAAIVYLLIEGRQQAERVIRAIARRMPFVQEETASRFVHQLADRIVDLSKQPELVRRGAAWAAANWLLDAAALWVFLRAFGESVNPVNLIVAYGVVGVLAAIPITPGGLGVVETALPALLITFGVPAGPAGAAVLSWRLVQFWMPIPLGGLAYASLRLGDLGRRRRLAAVRDLAHEAGEHAGQRVWDEPRASADASRPEVGLDAAEDSPDAATGT